MINMNKKLIIMLSIAIMLASPLAAYAQDMTINYVVSSNPSFSVTGSGIMTFTGTREAIDLEPLPQNISIPTPYAVLTNTGNVAQSFKVRVTTANPSGIVLKIASDELMTGAITVTTNAQTPPGWENVAKLDDGSNTVNMYVLASFNGGSIDGTYTRTLNVSSGLPFTPGGGGGGDPNACVNGFDGNGDPC
jgi:hypothetical protein